MRKISLFLLALAAHVISAKGQTHDDFRRFLIINEGYSHIPYKDSLGYLHIGIGHRIYGPAPRYWSETQIEQAFERDFLLAYNAAHELVPSLNTQPYSVRLVVVGMVFNLGITGFARFTGFRQAIHKEDYALASRELKQSLWSRQTPGRARFYIKLINSN